MFLFQLGLALGSLRKTPWLSTVCILAIALGISVTTSMSAIHHILSKDPLPHKRDSLFNVRIDGWDPDSEFFGVEPGDPPKSVTWQDMSNLRKAGNFKRSTGVANALAYAFPSDPSIRPWQASFQLTHADFFAMFEIPIRYGTAWDEKADQNREPVVVLSHETNEKLFGGANSVGRSLKLGNREFRICGVLDYFNPTPLYYDPVNGLGGPPREFFIPFDHILEQDGGFSITGDTDGWGRRDYEGESMITASEFYWIQLWVELEPGQRADYLAMVNQYVQQQKALGRHPRPANSRVQPMMEWVGDRNDGVYKITSGISLIAFLFLVVCSINLTGLLLGKFLARAPLIGVHRALGASRFRIFSQHLIECQLIGLLGGILGIAISFFTVGSLNHFLPRLSGFFDPKVIHLDGQVLLASLMLSLVAGVLAGLYPAWRACRITPAIQLKI